MCLVEHTTCPAGCVNTNPCAEAAALGRYYDMSVAGHKLVLSLGQTGQTKPIGIISVNSVHTLEIILTKEEQLISKSKLLVIGCCSYLCPSVN